MKNKSPSLSFLTCLLISLTFAVANSAAWADTTWTATSGDWFTATNWDNGVPTTSTDAFINNGGTPKIDHRWATARALTLGAEVGDSGAVSVVGAANGFGGALAVGPCSNCTDPLVVEGSLNIGKGGSGTMSITDGGLVFSAGYAYIALFGEGENGTVSSNGTVTVDGAGSTWTLSGDLLSRLFVGGNGTGNPQGGTALLSVTNGGAVIVNNVGNVAAYPIYVGISGTMTGNGTITTNGNNFFSKLTAVNGTLAPTGTLTINGNLALNDPATTLCHVTPQAADRVDVLGSGTSGSATLKGRLLVILSGTFSRGEDCTTRFALVHADTSRTGTFSGGHSIQGMPLNAPYTPQITYDSNNVYLDLVFNNCE